MNATQKFHTVDAGHIDVTQQNVYIALFEATKSSFSIGSGLHSVA
jgi:hypothetical protein